MLKLIRIFGLYISLSANGKKLFRRLYGMLKDARDLPHYRGLVATINDTMNADKQRWFSCIRASDAGFKEFIPAWYITQSKIKPEQLYYRFFKMGAVLLYEHTSLFLAYNISSDIKSGKRCILLAFLKRVYDDLLDNEHIDKEILFNSSPQDPYAAIYTVVKSPIVYSPPLYPVKVFPMQFLADSNISDTRISSPKEKANWL